MLDYGHIQLLRSAEELGDYLIVCLSTDEFNGTKGKSLLLYEEQARMLEAIRYVDLVIPEERWGQKRDDIKLYHADVFVMGDDWAGKFDEELKGMCDIVYLPRTLEISTTQIKTDMTTGKMSRK